MSGLLADRGIHIVVTVTMVAPDSSEQYTILCFASFKAPLAFFYFLNSSRLTPVFGLHWSLQAACRQHRRSHCQNLLFDELKRTCRCH